MRIQLGRTTLIAAVFLMAVTFTTCAQGQAFQRAPKEDVDFRIVTDKLVYAPGSAMHVTFLVANTGDTPLYMFRTLSQCTSQIGSYSFSMWRNNKPEWGWYLFMFRDRNGKEQPVQGCSADLDMEHLDVVNSLTKSTEGICLYNSHVYGLEVKYILPDKRGIYRLKAKLIPAGFTESQERALSEKHIRVLPNYDISAPVVTITVK